MRLLPKHGVTLVIAGLCLLQILFQLCTQAFQGVRMQPAAAEVSLPNGKYFNDFLFEFLEAKTENDQI